MAKGKTGNRYFSLSTHLKHHWHLCYFVVASCAYSGLQRVFVVLAGDAYYPGAHDEHTKTQTRFSWNSNEDDSRVQSFDLSSEAGKDWFVQVLLECAKEKAAWEADPVG